MKTIESRKNQTRLIFSLEDEIGMENWPLPAIVPVVFSRYKGRIEVECYFGVYDIVRTFLWEYEKNPFSNKALKELDRRLTPYFEAQGYERGSGICRFYKSFVLWDPKRLCTEVIVEGSELLTAETIEKVKVNKTGFNLKELLQKGLPAAVTVKNGELISIASINEHGAGQRLLEATVYTIPSSRGRGWGKSNTALLCQYLLEKKKGVVYCCSCHNRASAAVAEAVGFRSESRFYAVDAYKKET